MSTKEFTRTSSEMSVHSRSNWNLEMLVFEEGKTGVPREKPLGAE